MAVTVSAPVSGRPTGTYLPQSDLTVSVRNADIFGADYKVTAWDGSGTQLFLDVSAPFGTGAEPWHIRDEGDGTFTFFYVADPQGARSGGTITFDSTGAIVAEGTYEQPSEIIDVGGFPVERKLSDDLAAPITLPDGGVAGIAPDSRGNYTLVLMQDDDTIRRSEAFSPTTAPVAGAASLPSFDLTRSGDTLILISRYNDPFTNPEPENVRELFLTVFDLDGNITVPEMRITDGDLSMGGFGDEFDTLAVETLRNGNVVIAYKAQKAGTDDETDFDVWMQVRGPGGALVQAEQLVNTGFVAGRQSYIQIHRLQDGTFAITFDHNLTDFSASIFENTGVVQLFDETGTAIGGNEAPLDRFEFATGAIIREDGTGWIGNRAVTIDVGGAVTDVNAGMTTGGGNVPTSGNDDLTGTGGRDMVALLGGSDIYDALGGNDAVAGGPGNDEILGGGGKDVLQGDGGQDTLTGDGGDDTLDGGGANDRLEGGLGDDVLRGGAGSDFVNGGAGRDLVKGGAGGDNLKGGAGRDTLEGAAGLDTLSGGGGKDRLEGGGKADFLNGGGGNDRLFGGASQDSLEGGAGQDILFGEAGNDTLEGGAGADRLVPGTGVNGLDGGAGADVFVFDVNAAGIDSISGFDAAADVLEFVGLRPRDVQVDPGRVSTTITYGDAGLISIGGVYSRSDLDFDFV